MDIRHAVINTIAVPLNGLGISLYSIFSRIPAIIVIAIKNPNAVAKPFTTPSKEQAWISLRTFLQTVPALR